MAALMSTAALAPLHRPAVVEEQPMFVEICAPMAFKMLVKRGLIVVEAARLADAPHNLIARARAIAGITCPP